MKRDAYIFESITWEYQGKGAWTFVTLPFEVADDIDARFAHLKRGWGSLPCEITLNQTTWESSIFTDKKSNSYLLPIKSSILENRKDQSWR